MKNEMTPGDFLSDMIDNMIVKITDQGGASTTELQTLASMVQALAVFDIAYGSGEDPEPGAEEPIFKIVRGMQ